MFAALMSLALAPNPVYAGAWTQAAGNGQVVFTGSVFRTGTVFDESGARVPFSDAGQTANS